MTKITQFWNTSKSNQISTSLEYNKNNLLEALVDVPEVLQRDLSIRICEENSVSIFMIGINGLIDDNVVQEQVIAPLLSSTIKIDEDLLLAIKKNLYVNNVNEESKLNQCILKLMKGSIVLLIDGLSKGLVIDIKKSETRSIDEPPTGTVVRGSREGFIESAHKNINLIMKRIAHPKLKHKTFTIGEFSQTNIIVTYVEDIVEMSLVEKIENRLNQIIVDDISSSGQIEQYLGEHVYSIFPTTGNTERPDQLAAMMMEGRIGVIVDGDPMVLFYPSLFIEKLQSVEDYGSKPFYASFVRLLRFFALLLSVLLPSLYICAVNIHKEMIPSTYLLVLEQSREGVPFPLVLETLMLLILFEIVREAGIRMPRAIGQAVSIVGALILGEVSVQAGIISAQTIIIVATASITTFIVTPVAGLVSLLRLIYIVPSAIFGFYGLMICMLITLTHMVNLTSMGVPYLQPLMPFYLRDLKDFLVRLPYPLLKYRPRSIPNVRPIRFQYVPKKVKEKS